MSDLCSCRGIERTYCSHEPPDCQNPSMWTDGNTEQAQALLDAMRARIMNFGGFERAPHGDFWIARTDVLRLIDEMAPSAPTDAAGDSRKRS
jgi:hypothetical protein